MEIYDNPDHYEVEVLGQNGFTMKRKSEKEIIEIDARRKRETEDHILAQAEIIRRGRLLKDKNPTKQSDQQGLFRKYNVSRVDGKNPHAEYFVLDLTNDKFAKAAIQAYIEACKDQYPYLAQDLTERYING